MIIVDFWEKIKGNNNKILIREENYFCSKLHFVLTKLKLSSFPFESNTYKLSIIFNHQIRFFSIPYICYSPISQLHFQTSDDLWGFQA